MNEDWAVVQAVDPATGRSVPDGEWGSLTITTLDRDNGLLRYDLEEACRILREPCVCGETTIRALWGGRMSHLLSVDGQRFQVIEVERALRELPIVCEPTLEYVVVRPEASGGRLRVRVESDRGEGADEAKTACAAAIRARLGVDADVEIVARGTLPRSGYKAIRLVDA
jgi:phenylacetate-CoA ligase